MELDYWNKILALLFHQVKIKLVRLYSNKLIISTYIIHRLYRMHKMYLHKI